MCPCVDRGYCIVGDKWLPENVWVNVSGLGVSGGEGRCERRAYCSTYTKRASRNRLKMS